MSVETAYRPCKDCIDGRHDVCALEDGCWCNLCWVIVPTKTETPDKAERGYKTQPTTMPMRTRGPYDATQQH